MESPPSAGLRQLYEARTYPPMSHPVTDPAATAATALLGGLRTPPPSSARILEIGCASGHNLLPLAARWPGATLVGIDLSESSIRLAQTRAASSNLRNVRFHTADLRDFTAEPASFDFIIAHGVFSWVPDEIKSALLFQCRHLLSPSGIAAISFNLASGWAARLPVIEIAGSIQRSHRCDETTALRLLLASTDQATPQNAALRWIVEDMIAKGPDILPFDDFAPVNDPWPLDRFLHAALSAGLHGMGESDPAENLPSTLGDDQRNALLRLATDPLQFQLAADLVSGRTFRSLLLRRDDAPVSTSISTGVVFDLCLRPGKPPSSTGDPAAADFYRKLSTTPECRPVEEITGSAKTPQLARLIYDGISGGAIRPRIEPLRFDSRPPQRPLLDPFRLLCARQKLPLVDAWHVPCTFPGNHFEVLALMDGTRPLGELAAFSKTLCPELAFQPWLEHLAGRGLFRNHLEP